MAENLKRYRTRVQLWYQVVPGGTTVVPGGTTVVPGSTRLYTVQLLYQVVRLCFGIATCICGTP